MIQDGDIFSPCTNPQNGSRQRQLSVPRYRVSARGELILVTAPVQCKKMAFTTTLRFASTGTSDVRSHRFYHAAATSRGGRAE